MSIINFDERKGKLREKIRILSEGIEKGPKYCHYQDFIERGSAYKKLREFEKAVKDFTFVLSLNKNLVKKRDAFISISERGRCYTMMKSYEKARHDFLFNHQLFKSESTYNDLAYFFSSIKEHQNVIDVCTSILRRNKSTYAHEMRGMAFRELKRFDFSLKDFTFALSMNQNKDDTMSSHIFLQRGTTYDDMERFEDAISDYTRAINGFHRVRNSIDKGDLEEDFLHSAYYRRGTIYMKQKRYRDAIYDFSKSIEFDPESSSTSKYYDFCFKDREKARKLLFEEERSSIPEVNNFQIVIEEEEEVLRSNSQFYDEVNTMQIALVDDKDVGRDEDEDDDDEGEFFGGGGDCDKKWICLSDERKKRGW